MSNKKVRDILFTWIKIIAMLISIETCFYCSHLLKITFSSSHSLKLLPHLLHPMHSFVKDMSAGPVSSLTPAFSAERFSVRRSSLALPQNCSCWDAYDSTSLNSMFTSVSYIWHYPPFSPHFEHFLHLISRKSCPCQYLAPACQFFSSFLIIKCWNSRLST